MDFAQNSPLKALYIFYVAGLRVKVYTWLDTSILGQNITKIKTVGFHCNLSVWLAKVTISQKNVNCDIVIFLLNGI
jgi:hypothetical protein